MKKLKANQLGPWCHWCPPKTTRAVWRPHGSFHVCACDEHIPELKQLERDCAEVEAHITEADRQTWMRL